MDISSATLPLLPCPPPSALALSSSLSPFSNTISLSYKTSRPGATSLVLRRNQRTRKSLTCNALFGLGVPELVVIAGVAALVFGPKKLPEVGKSIGKTVKSFQQAAKEFESELKKDTETLPDNPPENPVAASGQHKPDVEVSSTKESV